MKPFTCSRIPVPRTGTATVTLSVNGVSKATATLACDATPGLGGAPCTAPTLTLPSGACTAAVAGVMKVRRPVGG